MHWLAQHRSYIDATRRTLWGLALVLVVPIAARADETAEQLVEQAVQAARAGSLSQRDALLERALQKNPQLATAHWLRGEVRGRQGWQTLTEFQTATAGQLDRIGYSERRTQTAPTAADLLKLADWCAQHHLPEQERAHLTAVLALAPDHTMARTRLQFVRVGGEWYSRQEIQDYLHDRQRYAQAKTRWGAQVEAARSLFRNKDIHVQEQARQKLLAVNDVFAIPLAEQRVAAISDAGMNATIEFIAKFPDQQATLALCRIAVQAPQEEAILAATRQLHRRQEQAVYPILVGALHAPAQMSQELYTDQQGRIVVRQELFREESEELQRAVNTRVFEARQDDVEPLVARQRQEQAAQAEVQRLQAAAEERNRTIVAYNQKVCRALRDLSGESFADSPADWWQWWNDRNEVYSTGSKPIDERNSSLRTIVSSEEQLRRDEYNQRRLALLNARRRYECFAAGTKVWTATGLVEIERLTTGDLVLAQHPETGELVFKPVLKPTTRPPAPICRVTIGSEIFECSGGHPFLGVNRGWVRARELKAGDEIIVLGKVLPVSAMEKRDDTVTMYNLVVADFHTYFVGESAVLTHDNTACQPVSTIMPGSTQRISPVAGP